MRDNEAGIGGHTGRRDTSESGIHTNDGEHDPPEPFKESRHLKNSYQLPSADNGQVDVVHTAVVCLKHLGGPQSTVRMDPVVLAGVEQTS